jgi:cell division protein FtsQ
MHQLIDKKNKIVIYLLLLLILSTTSGKFEEEESIYLIKIDAEGLSKNENSKLFNELSNLFYRNIFIIRKKEINEVISKYNIIEEYNIKKIYPSTLSIIIKPTKFIAKISDNNELLVGANGKLINRKETKETLPYIFGEFNSEEFLKFRKNISMSTFQFDDIKTIFFFPSNRWDIKTINDILIKLPNNNLLQSLNLAQSLISSGQIKDKKIIDLRVRSHLIVK